MDRRTFLARALPVAAAAAPAVSVGTMAALVRPRRPPIRRLQAGDTLTERWFAELVDRLDALERDR
jgi:hypothetical protein